jgi:carboxyl-terminal processing protease
MPKRNFIWVLAILAATAVTLWVMRNQTPLSGVGGITEFEPVTEAYRQIRDGYYRRVNNQELRRGAVKGMMEAIRKLDKLDTYSQYIPPDEAEGIQDHVVEGKDSGLGLRLEIVDGQVKVVGSLRKSPAHKAGLTAGDRLLAVDGVPVDANSLEKAERPLKGEVGTTAKLTLLRGGSVEPEAIWLTRAKFDIDTVQGLYQDRAEHWVYWGDPGRQAAYVRVREFGPNAAQHIKAAYGSMGRPKGLILDLRDNPGGLEQEAFETADLFLSEGVIMTKIDRTGKPVAYVARADGTYPPDVAVVILINGKTASAAEIVAGAMRLHHRAILVGSRTLGKGCIQSMIPLKDDLGHICLTTAEFLVGEDQDITRRPGSANWGVDPHVALDIPPAFQDDLRKLRARAEVICPPLPSTIPATTRAGDPPDVVGQKIMKLDVQLALAAQLLQQPEEMKKILEDAKRAAEKARTTQGAAPGHD